MEVPAMESREERIRAQDAKQAAEQREQHKHPARPQGSGAGFAEGAARDPVAPGDRPGPDFARGERTGPESDVERQRRFSEGIEQEPEDAPDKSVERRFSEGSEESPTSD
jgi:hypothetical protein